MTSKGFPLLGVIGGGTVLYAVLVLGYVSTSPDIRLRSLISEDVESDGVRVRVADGLRAYGPKPENGSIVIEIDDQPTRSFPDFIGVLRNLGRAKISSAGKINPGQNPLTLDRLGSLPGLVEQAPSVSDRIGTRWVRVRFRQPDTAEITTSFLQVQSLPLADLATSFVWFVLQLGLLAVGAIAYWNRPFDRAARLFFAMSIVTMGGYIGGYHWWVIAGSVWLMVPFIVMAVLVPAVTLHFFLVYPKAPTFFPPGSRAALAGLYVVPVLTIAGFVASSIATLLLSLTESGNEGIPQVLGWLSIGVYTYLGVACLYFLAAVGTLIYNYRHTENSIERYQLTWISRAAIVAAGLIGYSLTVGRSGNGNDFALGGTSLPMFLASVCFMIAYAIGMVRHRLMHLDQIFEKGSLYYVVSAASTVLFAILFAAGSLLGDVNIVRQTFGHQFAWLLLLTVVAGLLLLFRDRLQRFIDRHFFREKYQFDHALRQMNQAAGHLASPDAVADMMLTSCRDVLRVVTAGCYLRRSNRGPFQLAAVVGSSTMPFHLPATEELLSFLRQRGFCQRTVSDTREERSPGQVLLWELDAVLLQTIETSDGTIGFVVVGQKAGGAAFTAEDLTFLNAMCQVTTVALQTAKVSQELTQLNDELQRKSERIVEQNQQIEILRAELETRSTHSKEGGQPSTEIPTEPEFDPGPIQGHSPALLSVLETARKVADSTSTVLVRGENGTGKELLAKVLHTNSPRRDRPLIAVNCGALSPSLLESELFGHVRGAFTGAVEDKVGRFEAASGGTLFLDEIGDIPMETQVKLLRVLQERVIERVGSGEPIPVDIRLITATNKNLEQMIAEKTFREDLLYRLNVITITLPPLRDRPEDLVELTLHFLRQASEKAGKTTTFFEADALAVLERYHWPGNIRELQNVIERAVVLAEGERITVADLPAGLVRAAKFNPVFQPNAVSREVPTDQAIPLPKLSVAEMPPTGSGEDEASERVRLLQALQEAAGNKAEAARRLGLPRSTYYSKLKKYGMA